MQRSHHRGAVAGQRRKTTGFLIIVLILMVAHSPGFRFLVTLPSHVRLNDGETMPVPGLLPLVGVYTDGGFLQVEKVRTMAAGTGDAGGLEIRSTGTGHSTLEFRLLGILPVRRVAVDVVAPLRVMPGGQSIGVMAREKGVTVVGLPVVVGPDGQRYSPARDAGIETGDVILSIDGEPIQSEEQVSLLVRKAGAEGRPCEIVLRRGGRELTVKVTPVLDATGTNYMIGIYIRGATAGVGTLSFWDPVTGVFTALGHIITDSDTNRVVDVAEGYILPAVISAVEPGRRGQPGGKIGTFSFADPPLGKIERNTQFGIVGRLSHPVRNGIADEPVNLGMAVEVRPGPAQMLTVINGQTVQSFSIEIERVVPQAQPGDKGLVLRVTDPVLLEKTGGIIQGMSGSPILQDGRLVGVVTHVMINDPTRGYGIYAEWMAANAGLLGNEAENTTLERIMAA